MKEISQEEAEQLKRERQFYASNMMHGLVNGAVIRGDAIDAEAFARKAVKCADALIEILYQTTQKQ